MAASDDDLLPVLNAYRAASSELHDLYVELSEVNATVITSRSAAYAQAIADGLAVTAARESAEFSVANLRAEACRLQGTIDALTARLRWLDVHVQYLMRP